MRVCKSQQEHAYRCQMWRCGAGMAAGLQREYDASGALTEVRSRTAVLGGWVGGRM